MVLPLQSLGQRLLQVGGGCWEGELDSDAAAVVEDGGEVVSFRRGEDGELIVRLTCRTRERQRGLQTWPPKLSTVTGSQWKLLA